MGNCDSRKYPARGYDATLKRCGYYNDWIRDDNFCMPPTEAHRGTEFCNDLGAGEWKLRTPFNKQGKSEFVGTSGNTPGQLNAAVARMNNDPTAISKREQASEVMYSSSEFSDMIESEGSLRPSSWEDNKDMGPLYVSSADGSPILLWTNWINFVNENKEFPGCTYDSHRRDNIQTIGCCSEKYESCGIVGGINVSCIRDNFAANDSVYGDIACCFNDLVCEPGAENSDEPFAPEGRDGDTTPWKNNDKCFRSGQAGDMRTCNPESRNLGGSYCGDVLKDYCNGNKVFPGTANWLDAWDPHTTININAADGEDKPVNVKGVCIKALMRQMSGPSACKKEFGSTYAFNIGNANLSGMMWANDVIESVFSKYFAEFGSPLLGPNDDGLEASLGTQSFLYDFCKSMPFVCKNALLNMCKNMKEEKISSNPTANHWCGCYMPEDQYTKYSKGSFLVSPECTPFCSQDGTIPRVDSNNYPKYCQQNICIINNAILNMVNTRGDVNFNEVCPGCGKSENSHTSDGKTTSDGGVINATSNENHTQNALSCQCKMDNITLTSINSKFRNLNLATNCGGAKCTNDDGEEIACASNKTEVIKNINNITSSIKTKMVTSKFRRVLMVIVGILIVGALLFVLFVYRKRFFHGIKGFTDVKPGETYRYTNGQLL
jgi:hypothetical protein